MSYSARVKAELAALSAQKRCCVNAELGGLIFGASVMTLSGTRQVSLSFRTDDAAVIRRALKLFNASGPAHARPRLLLQTRTAGRRQYLLQLSQEDTHRLLREQGMLRPDGEGGERFCAPRRVMRRHCCRRAYLRGSFLACGYMADPRRRYHAEWVFQDAARASRLKRVLSQCGLTAGLTSRRDRSVVYIRDGDRLAELLKLMGASLSVLSMENSRAEKSLRENTNRATNCDHANLKRQLSASAGQVLAIERISRHMGLNALPQRLEALARMRLAQPDASLADLGGMLDPELSKSGVQHRMQELMKLSQTLPDMTT